MNSTAHDEITAYVFAVRAALGDLPEAQRDELLEDLAEHLTEVMADGEGSLTERLGSPEAYAAELRGTAPFVGGFPDPPRSVNPFAELREQFVPQLREHVYPLLRMVDVRLGKMLGYPRARDFFVLLRPAWWVVRGYLAAMVVAVMLDGTGQPIGLLPRIGGSDLVALFLLGVGVLGSIWLGRRSLRLRRWPRLALYLGSFVLVMVAFSGFVEADSSTRDSYYSDVNYDNPYSGVEDVFVYDQEGKLIDDARLFDQNGQPIHLGNASCYDEDGNYVEDVDPGVYPYCPEHAPFRMPGAAPKAAESEKAGSKPTKTAPASADPTTTPSRPGR
ncbi:HAAS signaling domain-containing protein [Actinoplanes sp. NPDC049316]|uniref:HAAS signaling domain-containing protein n=1 Tax=Actinoplanes sp. NPDC049316 TaxID=3154727 RepID=UPI003419615E